MKNLKKFCFALLLTPFAFSSLLTQKEPLIKDKNDLFVAVSKDRSSYIERGTALNAKIADEGFVLLKNDGSLPLAKDTKISLCGKSSVSIVRGGTGAAAGSISNGVKGIDLVSSLEDAGFKVNPGLVSFYKDVNRSGSGRNHGNDGWRGNSESTVGETPWSSYDSNLLATFNNYKDVGIQVISRVGMEGADIQTIDSTDDVKFGLSNKHALEMSDNEKDLFDHLHALVDKIIIILNTPTIFECDEFLKDEKVAGILWIGNPGDVGVGAVGRIFSGEVNPSGRTVDTWARDFTKDPTFQNFGDNRQHGKVLPDAAKLKHQSLDTMFASDGAPMMSFGTDKNYTSHLEPRWFDEENKIVSGGVNGVRPASYVSYEEGVYVDYRYYETRYQNILNKSGKTAADSWYNGEEGVVFPFGYGLSYTSFTQEIVQVNPKKKSELDSTTDMIEVSIKVTNTGKVAGKDAVQLYWKAPYIDGGIEKADHVLCSFDKTKTIEPNKSQIVNLSFHLQDVANYDYLDANGNGFKGYELDAGKYGLLLSKNAHEAYDEIEFEVAQNGIKYLNNRFTGKEVKNRFTDNGIRSSIPGVNDIEFTNMSRRDFETTFPKFPSVQDRTVKTGSKYEEFLTHEFNIWDIEEDNDYTLFPREMIVSEIEAKTKGFKQANSTLSAETRIQFETMRGVKYDDSKWDELINQMTWSELMWFIEDYRMSSPQITEMGKGRAAEGDGSQKFYIIWWVSSPIIAATFNPRLANEQGECIADEARITNRQGWWGPSANIHRSPFGGRNFENYSADPFLTGKIASSVAGAASRRGVFVQMRSFGVYNQEKNRESGIVFVNEQALREIYLKGFEMAVTEANIKGLLGSYTRIGLVDSAASYSLNTEILRNEWGFKGSILSDMTHSGSLSINDKCYENVTARVLSGQNCQLDPAGFSGQTASTWNASKVWSGGTGAPTYEHNGTEHISFTWWNAVREAVKGHLYMTANSLLADNKNVFLKQSFTKSLEVRKDFKMNIEEDMPDLTIGSRYNGSKITSVSYKINENTPLPMGLSLDGDVLKGKLNEVGLTRFEVIVQVKLANESGDIFAVGYELEATPNGSSSVNDGNKSNASFMTIGIAIGVVAIVAISIVSVVIFYKHKKKGKEA